MDNDTGTHYRKEYKGIKLDPARICLIYGVTHPIQQAMVKKSLVTGGRGKKGMRDDIADIMCACQRWLEMMDEDENE